MYIWESLFQQLYIGFTYDLHYKHIHHTVLLSHYSIEYASD